MRVIGTAGHVDHGKSTLVQALTGVHPDRLKEEREREMTIDLGFAWLTLPDGEEVGIVDVPGHRDFIENMLAGVGGIDAALFVIAADEGVMPQTREHLSILDLLQVQGGVVALTKVDLIRDPDWLDLVEEEIRQHLSGTVLAEAPIIRVSGRTEEGIPQLLESLSACLVERPPRHDYGKPRLPVDRVFSIAGFGTVVTGTLLDGQMQVGDEIVILPAGYKGRVRGLQSHKKKEDIAVPGSRTAINISGVSVEQIQRGDIVAHPKDYQPTRRMDVRFRLLPEVSISLKHNLEVKFFISAAEVVARVRLLGVEELKPGEEGWLQLETKQPIVAVRGDRYILRRPSPGETLGGGFVIDSHPKGRHKRFSKETIERLSALAQGTPDDVLLQALMALKTAPLKEVIAQSSLDENTAQRAIDALVESGQLLSLEGNAPANLTAKASTLVMSRSYWDQLSSAITKALELYHQNHPLRRGMPREELKSRMRISPRVFNAVINQLENEGILEENGPLVYLTGHEIQFNPQQQQIVNQLIKDFEASPYSPPTVKECQNLAGDEVFAALVGLGVLIQVSPEVVFSRVTFEDMVGQLRNLFVESETISAAQVRDYFNTSRRYALALLEYLDEIGLTVREGDVRRLNN